ncbi:hypothetical protein JVB16_13760 [Enterobacter hormaechei]|uniref:hypothetical protein n=1 Tax=Enterobacter TaxID=547 RepID=UPI0005CCD221|nr:hypothetical protein [Enterobacter hormaechei]MBU5666373.1 hypothetical protein [Enterobacteriaceae bacterium S32_ASV_15]GJK33567.1 hypothetical protein TUM17557_05650 [Enterobacter cloacae]GJL06257.1 hypothetical protein TUM17571_05650 [Klebsiella pneumoniae]EME7881432.1 hypothetical protein [Enterobacter hormaechei]KJC03426.1 hypothetical protein TN43_04420 [Enterobacter hormaechei]
MANLLDLLGIDSRRSSMTLVEYKYDTDTRDRFSKYLVRHTSSVSKTTLEQYVTIERDRSGAFKPLVALDDFPSGLSDRESMLKLADWLHRLGVAIEDEWSNP